MVRRIAFLVLSAVVSSFAQDDEAVVAFKASFDAGNYQETYEMGGALCATHPDDSIIRYQYSAAALIVGDFLAVAKVAESDPSIPQLPLFYNSIENLGFGVYSFYTWMNQLLSLAAMKKVDAALDGIEKAAKFEYRPLLFLHYLLLLHQGRDAEAEMLRGKWFPQPYDGVTEGELFAKRIIPAMRDPKHLDQWLSTAASYDETMLLLACVGFRDWLDGNREGGLERMSRAVAEGNPGSAGIPHVLLSLCLPPDTSICPLVAPGLHHPRWQKQTTALTAYYKAHADCNWPQVLRQLEQLIALSPRDIDHQAIRMLIQLIQGRFREAGETADVALKNIPWNTNNVLCMRLYRPLIHLLLNEQVEFRAALVQLGEQEMEYSWKRAVEVLKDPSAFDAVAVEFADQADKLGMPLAIRALMAEVDGDYILAETLWMRFITEEPFYKFLEFYLADARLKIISPLAAVQRIEDAKNGNTE